ncbi:unnamed protein product, partial [Iphiclides podalirius]
MERNGLPTKKRLPIFNSSHEPATPYRAASTDPSIATNNHCEDSRETEENSLVLSNSHDASGEGTQLEILIQPILLTERDVHVGEGLPSRHEPDAAVATTVTDRRHAPLLQLHAVHQHLGPAEQHGQWQILVMSARWLQLGTNENRH